MAVTAALLACVPSADASPITYIETATATGTLGATPFTNALVTLTLVADTSTVGPGAGGLSAFQVNPGTATISIGSLGTFLMTGGVEAFSTYHALFSGQSIVGIGQKDNAAGTSLTGILAQSGTSLYGYDLKTAMTSSSGPCCAGTGSTSTFFTTAGDLHFTSQPTGDTLTVTGGNGTNVVQEGGTLANPTQLSVSGVGQLSGNIGEFGTVDY